MNVNWNLRRVQCCRIVRIAESYICCCDRGEKTFAFITGTYAVL